MKTLYALAAVILLTGCSQRQCQTVCDDGCDDVAHKTYVHKYGMTVSPDEWHERGGHGQVVTKQKDGVKITSNYEAGQRHGETTYTFPYKETIEKIETFEDDQLVAIVEHYPSGSPRRKTHIHSPVTQEVTTWYEDGNPKSVETHRNNSLHTAEYFTINNDLETRIDNGVGMRITRDDFGQVASHDELVNGAVKTQTTFHPNESPKEVIPYHNGQVHGRKRTFLPDGEPNTLEEWNGGTQEGTTTVFQNGEKYSEVPYHNGMKNGIEHRYGPEGTIVEQVTWKDDEKHGPCYSYFGTGCKIDWYYQGRAVSKAEFHRQTGPRG